MRSFFNFYQMADARPSTVQSAPPSEINEADSFALREHTKFIDRVADRCRTATEPLRFSKTLYDSHAQEALLAYSESSYRECQKTGHMHWNIDSTFGYHEVTFIPFKRVS